MATLRLVSGLLLLGIWLALVLVLLGLIPLGDNREPANNTEAYPSAPKPPPPKPGFDYFLLALQWPSAYCYKRPCNPRKPPPNFTIHGLWPQKNDGTSPQYCDTSEEMTDQTLRNNEKDLLEYWPDLENAKDFKKSMSFWRYQWKKHGTCSSDKFKSSAYLTTAFELARKHRKSILDALRNGGIKDDGKTRYKSFKALDVIKNLTGVEAKLSFHNDNLLEVRLCFEADGKTLRDCYPNFIFVSNTQLSNLESTSTLKEVEDEL